MGETSRPTGDDIPRGASLFLGITVVEVYPIITYVLGFKLCVTYGSSWVGRDYGHTRNPRDFISLVVSRTAVSLMSHYRKSVRMIKEGEYCNGHEKRSKLLQGALNVNS